MLQVSIKADSELFGGQLQLAQHPFGDVAMVAKQTSGLAGVVAMIGFNLSALNVPFADSAAATLNGEKFGNVRSGEPSSPFAGLFSALLHHSGIGANLRFVSGLLSRLVFGRPVLGAPSSSGLWGFGSRLAARLNLWTLMILPRSLARLLRVPMIVSSGFGEIRFPLFGGAVGLLHAAQETRNSPHLNHAFH